MKILSIGDSFALPRQNVAYEETWIYLLKNFFSTHELINLSKRAQTTDVLCHPDFLEFYNPDVVIIQLGIVDCAPRYLSYGYEKFLNKFPMPSFLRTLIWVIIKKGGRKQQRAYVSKIKFQKNIEKYLDRCLLQNVTKVIFIKLGMPTSPMIESNEGIKQAVMDYNLVLDSLQRKYPFLLLIDPLYEGLSKNYVEDGYHPNKEGHMLIYSKVKIIFEDVISDEC